MVVILSVLQRPYGLTIWWPDLFPAKTTIITALQLNRVSIIYSVSLNFETIRWLTIRTAVAWWRFRELINSKLNQCYYEKLLSCVILDLLHGDLLLASFEGSMRELLETIILLLRLISCFFTLGQQWGRYHLTIQKDVVEHTHKHLFIHPRTRMSNIYLELEEP